VNVIDERAPDIDPIAGIFNLDGILKENIP
jgi:hypothetical protein